MLAYTIREGSEWPISPRRLSQTIINIVVENMALGPLLRELMPLGHTWVERFRGQAYLGYGSAASNEDWFETTNKSEPDAHFTICETARMCPIGTSDLFRVNHFNPSAEFGILIMVGEKYCWSKGYGTETTILILEYGFTCLGVHNIYLTVFTSNELGIGIYQRAWFRLAGSRRQNFRLLERAYDEVYLDCLATEFQSGEPSYLLPHSAYMCD